jgi:hypothetical protein
VESKRGVHTHWRVEQYDVSAVTARLDEHWSSITRLIRVQKTVSSKTNPQAPTLQQFSFRVSDLTGLTAEEFAQGIRGHWGIENRCHWVRDVLLNEDNNGIKHATGAVMMAYFNTLVINFLRRQIHDSISYARILFGQNVKELLPSIRT